MALLQAADNEAPVLVAAELNGGGSVEGGLFKLVQEVVVHVRAGIHLFHAAAALDAACDANMRVVERSSIDVIVLAIIWHAACLAPAQQEAQRPAHTSTHLANATETALLVVADSGANRLHLIRVGSATYASTVLSVVLIQRSRFHELALLLTRRGGGHQSGNDDVVYAILCIVL